MSATPGPLPGPEPPDLSDHDEPFVRVVKYSRDVGYVYAWTGGAFYLIRGAVTVIEVPMASFRDNELKAARHLLQAITEDLRTG